MVLINSTLLSFQGYKRLQNRMQAELFSSVNKLLTLGYRRTFIWKICPHTIRKLYACRRVKAVNFQTAVKDCCWLLQTSEQIIYFQKTFKDRSKIFQGVYRKDFLIYLSSDGVIWIKNGNGCNALTRTNMFCETFRGCSPISVYTTVTVPLF